MGLKVTEEKEEAKPWARATAKSLEAKQIVKVQEKRGGAPMDSKASVTTAWNMAIAPNGAPKERAEK